jgi:hypothetical protein
MLLQLYSLSFVVTPGCLPANKERIIADFRRRKKEPTEFQIDSFVLVQQRSAPETGLHTPWRGPLRVLNSKRGEYTLLDLTTNKEK